MVKRGAVILSIVALIAGILNIYVFSLTGDYLHLNSALLFLILSKMDNK